MKPPETLTLLLFTLLVVRLVAVLKLRCGAVSWYTDDVETDVCTYELEALCRCDSQRGQHAFLASTRMQRCTRLPTLLALLPCLDLRGTVPGSGCLFQRPCMY